MSTEGPGVSNPKLDQIINGVANFVRENPEVSVVVASSAIVLATDRINNQNKRRQR